MRIAVVAYGVVFIAASWYVTTRLFGRRIAAICALRIAVTPVILMAGTQVWPDIPGAAIGMVAFAVYAYALDRNTASKWILIVPVLAFSAAIVRFGAPIQLSAALLGLTIWRRGCTRYSDHPIGVQR